MDDERHDLSSESYSVHEETEPPADSPFKSWAGRLIPLVAVVIIGGLILSNLFSEDDAPESTASTLAASSLVADLPKGSLSGEAAADFDVPLLGGGRFNLADHVADDGRPIVLNYWASWCFPCREEMPEFDRVAQAKPEILMLGLGVEDSESNLQEFADEIGVSYPLAWDEPGDAADGYPYFGLPVTWIIDGDGIVIRQVTGRITEQFLLEILAFDLGI